jgi:hypothetical protein
MIDPDAMTTKYHMKRLLLGQEQAHREVVMPQLQV